MLPRRILLSLYLLALFFMGLGYLAIMPAFEGFDERAHYSSIRQIADTAMIPVLGESYVDQAYADYQGPRPYKHFGSPFNSNMIYPKFFSQPDLVEYYRRTYRESPFSTPFRPSQELNWVAQHPPLYYMLMAPVVKAVEPYSFVAQFFILRLVSFLLALAGVALGMLAGEQAGTRQQKDSSMIGFFLYPVMLPMFFPEFTRIGNDALCVFWVGCLAYLLSLWRRDEGNLKISLMMGVILGLGLLTKAFFIPVTVALAAFLSLRLWLDKGESVLRTRRRLSLLGMFYPALMIGGGWYLSRLALHGDISGSVDSIVLAQQGGLIAGLKAHFSFYAFMRGAVSTLFSYSWVGSWSFAYFPLYIHISLLVLIFLVFGNYLYQLRQRRLTDDGWLPVWLFVSLAAGLFNHLMVGLAQNGVGQTPGWYLHILMPFVAPALGASICSLLQKPCVRPFVIGLVLYAYLFQIVALWAQFSLFTGCAIKGPDAYYAFPSHAFCLDRTSLLIDRLAVLGWPVLAAVGFGGGAICALILVKYAFPSRQSPLSLPS
jgi:hypothetical protein